MAEDKLTVEEAADVLAVSKKLVYALCAQGLLPHFRFGRNRGTIRIDADELRAYAAACKVPATAVAGLESPKPSKARGK